MARFTVVSKRKCPAGDTCSQRSRLYGVGSFTHIEGRVGQDEPGVRDFADCIDARASVQGVPAFAARQRVVSRTALEGVVAGTAAECDRAKRECARVDNVVACAARNHGVRNSTQAVSADRADRHVVVRYVEINVTYLLYRVYAATADEAVRAGVSPQDVVVRVAGQRVAELRTGGIAKAADRGKPGCGTSCQVDSDPRGICAVVDRVRSRARDKVLNTAEFDAIHLAGICRRDGPVSLAIDAHEGVGADCGSLYLTDAAYPSRAGRGERIQIDGDPRGEDAPPVIENVVATHAPCDSPRKTVRPGRVGSQENELVESMATDKVLDIVIGLHDVQRVGAVYDDNASVDQVDGESQVGSDRGEIQRVVALVDIFGDGVASKAVVEHIIVIAGQAAYDVVARGSGRHVPAGAGERIVADRPDEHIEQVGIVREGRRRKYRLRLDRTGAVLEAPVPPLRGAACQASGGRDICAGYLRKIAHKIHSCRTLRHIATVKQDVATRPQRRAPACDPAFFLFELAFVEHDIAQPQCTGRSVRQDLHRRKSMVRRKDFADLIDAVVARVEHHHLDVAVTRNADLRTVVRA